MSVTKWFTGAALFLLVATAHAHAHLTAAVPARITALSLQREGEEPRKLAPLPAEMAARITIPLPKLLPGKYTLSWRAVGDDGHVVPGTLHFTVLESSASGGGGG